MTVSAKRVSICALGASVRRRADVTTFNEIAAVLAIFVVSEGETGLAGKAVIGGWTEKAALHEVGTGLTILIDSHHIFVSTDTFFVFV